MRLRERFATVPAALWGVLGAGLALRFLLLPFIHPWDGNTFHNLFAQLAAGENPYEAFWDRTLEARSRWHVGAAAWYEYFAYPPLLIYIYWPLAQVAALFAPLTQHFYVTGLEAAVPNAFPLPFLLLYKLPIWIADVAIAWMLWHRTRSVAAAALWMLNPLVLVVSGAWMFDSIPVALTLAAWLAYEKDRHALAGGLLALGFLAKFYPLFLLPVFALALVWRRDARVARLVAAFAVVAGALLLPFLPEVLRVFDFTADRPGGGLSLHQVWLSWLIFQDENLLPFQVALSPKLGALVLFAGLGAAYLLANRLRPPLERALLVTLLVFLLASKLVNEQYALWVLPFLIVEAARAPTTARRVALHALWIVPFAFLVVHVPVTAFWPGGLALTEALHDHLVVAAAGAVAAILFTAALVIALWAYWPRGGTVRQ